MRSLLVRLRYGRWLGSLLAGAIVMVIVASLVVGWRLMSSRDKTEMASTPAVTSLATPAVPRSSTKTVGLNWSVKRFVQIYFSYDTSTSPSRYRHQLAELVTPQFMESGQITLDQSFMKNVRQQHLTQTAEVNSGFIGETYRRGKRIYAAGRVSFSLVRYKDKQILWSDDNFSVFMEWVKTDQGWRITRLKS